jgi:glycosyltransferase involved in cell wall biosynthesis
MNDVAENSVLAWPGDGRLFAASPDSPVIAVVVPVFRHSVFLADAVTSACEQDIALDYRVVIVDDGCPHAETRRVATALALSFPDRVVYLRRTNGGLSAARNTGIEYALQRWPSLQAIYFLDADNSIEPGTLARAYEVLRAGGPALGWVFPDIAMFGSSQDYWDYSGCYSVLRHLTANVSEASSLVRRAVFDAGCRFDEAMRLGYEDWEFWWQCIEAGFVGRHVPFFGLRYRKRPESMLSESERDHDAVYAYMRRKHKALFRPRRMLSLAAEEAPRYALLSDSGQVGLCTDPRDTVLSDPDTVVRRITATLQNASLHSAPSFVFAASDSVMAALKVLRLDRFVFWWLQQRVSNGAAHFAGIELAPTESTGVALEIMDDGYWPVDEGGVHMVVADPNVLRSCIDDDATEWIRSLASRRPQPKISLLRIGISTELLDETQHPSPLFNFLHLFQRLHVARRQAAAGFPATKPRSLPSNLDLGKVPEKLLQSGPLLPLRVGTGYDVCIALPLVAFGGVEKVALNIAAELRRRGWRCHLLVLQSNAALTQPWLESFDSVSLHSEDGLFGWTQELQYLGSPYPIWVKQGDSRSVDGLLLPMDAVINMHCAALNGCLAKLRRAGVATVASLHVSDRSELGREVGHPFLSLGHEHAYDLFAPVSQNMADWCHALGVPEEKIVIVPNAPAYEMAPDEVSAVLARRAARPERRRAGPGEDAPLRVLFIGRFDRQKGLDRLVAIFERARAAGLPIAWRFIGGRVMDAAEPLSAEIAELAEPAIHDAKALTEAYEWADVLLLPSHWEGLPLTLLEAARLGVVSIAARVGAVDEAVEDGNTGILIEDVPRHEFAAAAVDALRRLIVEPGLLQRLSAEAARTMVRNWSASCDGLVSRLEGLIEANRITP